LARQPQRNHKTWAFTKMKIKRLDKVKINGREFKIEWNPDSWGGSFAYSEMLITIGTKCEDMVFSILCHEVMEICAVEMCVRLDRPDCTSDFIFVFDHRQYYTMMTMFSGVISEFIECPTPATIATKKKAS